MLVIDRRVNQEIVVTLAGEHTASGQPLELRIMLTETRHRRAKIGFDAPKKFVIARSELLTTTRDSGEDIRNGRLGP